MSSIMNNLRREIILNVKNIPGPSTPRKLVVIECDDYGGIRTPSKEVYKMLVERGLADPECRYRMDTLANVEDMEMLFQSLEKVKDLKGSSAVMTPICNVANPDFEKIKQSGFSEYHFESFTDTFLRYGRGPEVFELWKRGIEEGIFIPELHGREHLSVQLWMQKLKHGNPDLLLAFDHDYVALMLDGIPTPANGFRPEFYFTSQAQIPFLEKSISSGVELFKQLVGYTPRTFVPSNAIFHPILEHSLAKAEVKYLNVGHLNPTPRKNGSIRMKYYQNGGLGASGVRYYVRNCAFEPTEKSYNGIESTLKQIQVAFRWKKPAIISTHRANFVGGIEASNREIGLQELKRLLKAIVKRWPDVEFMSSSDMLNTLYP